MAHYAVLNEDNIVTQVFVGRDEDDLPVGVTDWEKYYGFEDHTVKRTSFNTRGGIHYDPETGEPSEDQAKAFRGNYAGIGFTYDEDLDAFIPPKPHEDATLDMATFSWVLEAEESEED
jgi:hypothetical protein